MHNAGIDKQKMEKILHTYVKNFQFFPKSAIYDEDSQLRISDFNRHTATLYFIVKTKKVNLLPSTFHVASDYTFCGQIAIEDKKYELSFSPADMLYRFPKLQEKFESIADFTDFCMNQWRDESRPKLSNPQKYAEWADVDIKKSSSGKLVIKCPLQKSITQTRNPYITLSPYQLVNYSETQCLAPLEIIYIGKCNDDTWQRIYNHNKWGLIEEFRDDSTEDLLVYFLEIDKSFVDKTSIGSMSFIHRDESELSIKDATLATEAVLINYFIKQKKFNVQHVGTDITKSDLILEKVKSKGYTGMAVEVGVDGPFGKLGTTDVGYCDYHLAQFTF